MKAGLADEGDPWDAYANCLIRVVEGRSQALAQRIAGTFTPTTELMDMSARAGKLYHRLHERTQEEGALRGDVTPADIVILLEMVSTITIGGGIIGAGDAVSALRLRYLSLLLQSLRDRGQEALPGVAASDDDLAGRWQAP